MVNFDVGCLSFGADGLIPAIAQDARTGAVLMMAYMNREALEATLRTGFATYYSRKRQMLWKKGETSGNVQRVIDILYDCDGDTLLLKVEQHGPACHTGSYSCFYRPITPEIPQENPSGIPQGTAPAGSDIIQTLYETILGRAHNPVEGSYTNYLLEKGVEKICKKVGEEASEVIIAAMKNDTDEIRYEAADLMYHLLVLLADRGLSPYDIWQELEKRRK